MYEFYEFEYALEEAMDAGLGYGLFANLGSGILGIVGYVFMALALYTIAQRRGIKNGWLSWIPMVNCWIIGSLSDQYRYVVKGEVTNKRKTLLILNIINIVLCVVMVIAAVGLIFNAWRSPVNSDEQLGAVVMAVVGILLLCLPIVGVSIAIKVIHFMAMYDIYTSCTPTNNVIFLVLSIIFNAAEPFFLFFTRNKDDGMPPRRQEPVYEAPRGPWNNTEYL